MTQVWQLREKLEKHHVNIKIGWTPGHCGIMLNDIADHQAKVGCNKGNESNINKVSFSACVRKFKEITNKLWQERWKRAPSGHRTRQIIPLIGSKLKWPARRTCAISVARAFLNDAGVADNLFRMKLVDSPNCQCGQARETVQHKILECNKFNLERKIMTFEIGSIWMDSKRIGNLNIDLQLLLNPSSVHVISANESEAISAAFFKFLQTSQISL